MKRHTIKDIASVEKFKKPKPGEEGYADPDIDTLAALVTFKDGYTVRFFVWGLTKQEYKKRAVKCREYDLR